MTQCAKYRLMPDFHYRENVRTSVTLMSDIAVVRCCAAVPSCRSQSYVNIALRKDATQRTQRNELVLGK